MSALPLAGIRVLDLSTLLPGPMCTLLLAEAGAEVIKVESPNGGDVMRAYAPAHGASSANFALLNAGKQSVTLDLKSDCGRERLLELVRTSDVLIEQFRPGVMKRLKLDWETLRETQPRLVYCSITGYGQHGPLAARAGHDLNYLAETGMLALAADTDGAPVLPPALIADIAGGAYPAFMNILLALRKAERSGEGSHVDVAMAANLFTLLYWALGQGFVAGHWPRPGAELVTGGSLRYQVYRTADSGFIAAAPLEDRFWHNFLKAIDAVELDDVQLPSGDVIEKVRARIASQPSDYWRARLTDADTCCSIVASLEEAVHHPQFAPLFERGVEDADGHTIPALPVPISPGFRDASGRRGYPAYGYKAEDAA